MTGRKGYAREEIAGAFEMYVQRPMRPLPYCILISATTEESGGSTQQKRVCSWVCSSS